MPVLAWTRAAGYLSQGYFSSAVREYQAGLTKFSRHKVAPYARLDLALCFERLGAYAEACEQLALIANQADVLADRMLPGTRSDYATLQQIARIRLCHALLLSNRGAEAAKIARFLRLDTCASQPNPQLLSVKALALLDSFSGKRLEAKNDANRQSKLGSAKRVLRNIKGKRSGTSGTRAHRAIVRVRSTTAGRATAISATTLKEPISRVSELKSFRAVHAVIDAVMQLEEGVDGTAQMIARAESLALGTESLNSGSLPIGSAQSGDSALWLWIIAGQRLLDSKNALRARSLLNRALALEPSAPRILSLLAQTYLVSGEGYNPNFAVQLATKACQHAGWQSAQAHSVLAECYYHGGDKLAALTMAQGSRFRSADPQIQQLLESLSDAAAINSDSSRN